MKNTGSIDPVLARIRRGKLGRNITAVHVQEASAGEYAPFPQWVPDRLVDAYCAQGIEDLYSHQAEAAELAHAGRNVVVVTPTASGKTLSFNLPVLSSIIEAPESRALYLFPTKALGQDQMDEVRGLASSMGGGIKTYTYDGDTPASARRAIREQGQIVVTNPDMLHTGILPHHTKWARLFANLQYVVLDELHHYRGVFGSHVANVIRRLKRVCRFHGSSPTFICCSATIANPSEHAATLIEAPVTLVDKSGAPRSEKVFVLYNPPVVDEELGIRRGALTEAQQLASRFIKADVQTITFTQSRTAVEVVVRQLKEAFGRGRPVPEQAISGYRGGYLPNLRRSIEAGLRDGSIRGVVSTNALELGVDIGALDAAILAGYPGTIASTLQQAGRSGRRAGRSCAILVARSNPLDQYVVNHPEFLFGATPEHALIDPDNLLVLLAHVKSASFELPFEDDETFGSEDLGELLAYLEDEDILRHAGTRWHYVASAYPADDVSIRNIAADNVVVYDTSRDREVIGEVDLHSAPLMVHPGAIYMVEGEQYHVDDLDWEQRRAEVSPVVVDYYSQAMSFTNVSVLDEFDTDGDGPGVAEHGEVNVVRRVTGYKKIKFGTLENLGYGDITLPDQEMHTTAYWLTVPDEVLAATGVGRSAQLDGLLGLAYALHHVAAVETMSDPRDIGRAVGDRSSDWSLKVLPGERGVVVPDGSADGDEIDDLASFNPTIYLYDDVPGGIGLAPKLYEAREILLLAARNLIRSCGCSSGCPSCVGPTMEIGEQGKRIALLLLDILEDEGR